jgi:sucrose phosphorylase
MHGQEAMKNQVQLITYVDRLGGGDLAALTRLLTDPASPLHGLFGGVHLLPFFDPIDGVDAGFDPSDHLQVDARLGDWSDIERLADQVDVMADVIVNHISSASPQFLDWSKRGTGSAFDGMFLTPKKVYPQGPTAHDVATIYRPRPGAPFTDVRLAHGDTVRLWTTFTPQQIDIDVQHAQGRAYLDSIIKTLARSHVNVIRLDAVGYAIKKAGTSCFMLPETFAFIDSLTRTAREHGIEVLVEVHAYHQRQVEIAKRVDWVYDFALPPLALHTLMTGDVGALAAWMRIRPTNALNVLDTHDGIGIIDIGADGGDRQGRPGLISPEAQDALVESIHCNSGGQSREATGAAASNLDLYQVNCTYYDALGRDDAAYLIARALQFFLPGIPQVYYVGLLAGENDMVLLKRSGVGRDINRHHYSKDDIAQAVRRPVVQDLFDLIRLRNQHPAFAGQFESRVDGPHRLVLAWRLGTDWIELAVDAQARRMRIRSDAGAGVQTLRWRTAVAMPEPMQPAQA